MALPYSLLRGAVQQAVLALYGAEHAGVDPAVHRSQFADYQADVALRLAKPLRQKPLDIAQAIAGKLELAGVADVSVSPPGFVNFRFTTSYLETELARLAADEDRLDPGELSFREFRIPAEKHVTDDGPQNGVAQELQSLVRRQSSLRDRRMREARFEQLAVAKTILQDLFAAVQLVLNGWGKVGHRFLAPRGSIVSAGRRLRHVIAFVNAR